MGYMHIDNLYKDTTILTDFKECYAMEKIHGTSAHVRYRDTCQFSDGSNMNFFSGGQKMATFLGCFNQEALLEAFKALGHSDVTVYGEAYGGNMQGMAHTYGNVAKFIAFDVMIKKDDREIWLDVPSAEKVCQALGLEFVHYTRIPCTIEAMDAERDADSVQAVRNGVGPGKIREGVVLRPTIEVMRNNDHRIMAKHKRAEFRETKTEKEVNPEKVAAKMGAAAAAIEWATETRLEHVLDKLVAEGEALDMPLTPKVLSAMVSDVKRESDGLLAWTDDIGKAIATEARRMYHAKIRKV